MTITQSTPSVTEVQWNAYFRDGTLNSEFFAPGAGPIAAAALNIVKAGDGWATLTVDNNQTGTVLVTGGILQVGRGGVGDTGAARGAAVAGLTANVGTTIAGTGAVQGATIINGTLRPGDEAGGGMGTLQVNGNLTLGASGVASMQLQRASYTAMNALNVHDALYSTWNAGHTTDAIYSHLLNDPITTSQHDQLRITGTLSVITGGKFSLLNNGYNPTAGDVINVADWTGAATSLALGGITYNGGIFRNGAESGTDLDLFQLGYGLLWDVSQFNTTGNLLVVEAPARQFYWNGDVDGNWNTNAGGNTNWLDAPGGVDPAGAPAFTDDVFFTANTASNLTTTLGQNFTINNLTFTGIGTANTAGSSITGNTLTLLASTGQGLTVQSGSGANSISSDVVLGASQTWTNHSASRLTVSGSTVSGTDTNLTVSGSGDTTITAAIQTNSGTVTKTDAGMLTLSGDSDYTGSTTVSGGTLSVGHANGLGSTVGATSVDTGATLNINAVTIAENITLNGTGVGSNGALTGTGTSGVSGTIELATDSSVGAATGSDVLTISGVVSGTGTGLTKVGAGTVILTADNTYTGNTTISGGALQLGTGGTDGSLDATSDISIATGATLAINRSDAMEQGLDFATNPISGGGGISQIGSGTTTLTANNTYTGDTAVTAGVLIVNGDQSTATGNVSVSAGATLGGVGTVGGDTLIDGTLSTGTAVAPGTVGSMTFAGVGTDVSFNSGSNWLVDVVQGVSPSNDAIVVGGNLNITGTTNLAFNLTGTHTPSQSYTIATYTGARTGFFSNYNATGTYMIGGFDYYLDYGTGTNSTITLTAVPEPTAFLPLLPLLLAGVWFVRRRRLLQAQAVA